MQQQLAKLKNICEKAKAIVNNIDINDEESEAAFCELNQLAEELGEIINQLEK